MSEKKDESSQADLSFEKDEMERDILLSKGFLQVMMEWEKPYMEACIDLLQPEKDVLEVGFGLGYSATQIQKYQPKSHTIIECDPVVIERAKEWAKSHSNVNIIEGRWQDVLPSLGAFDTIFFDDFPLPNDETVRKLKEQKIIKNALEQQQTDVSQLCGSLQDMMSSCKDRVFSDQEVEKFAMLYLSREDIRLEDLNTFIEQLKQEGNVTAKQKELFFKKSNAQLQQRREKLEKQKAQLEEKIQEANSLNEELQGELTKLAGVKFSDHDLETFVEDFLHNKKISPRELFQFLLFLEKQNNISEKQKIRVLEDLKKHKEEQTAHLSKEEIEEMEERLREIHYLKTALQREYEKLKDVKFTDKELQKYVKEMKSQKHLYSKGVKEFLEQLESAGNISPEQKKRYFEECADQLEEEEKTQLKDRCIDFFEQCLDKHMNPQAKMSAYVDTPTSKREYAPFHDAILTRKDVAYQEKTISIDVPENCKYYGGNKALVILIEKKK